MDNSVCGINNAREFLNAPKHTHRHIQSSLFGVFNSSFHTAWACKLFECVGSALLYIITFVSVCHFVITLHRTKLRVKKQSSVASHHVWVYVSVLFLSSFTPTIFYAEIEIFGWITLCKVFRNNNDNNNSSSNCNKSAADKVATDGSLMDGLDWLCYQPAGCNCRWYF